MAPAPPDTSQLWPELELAPSPPPGKTISTGSSTGSSTESSAESLTAVSVATLSDDVSVSVEFAPGSVSSSNADEVVAVDSSRGLRRPPRPVRVDVPVDDPVAVTVLEDEEVVVDVDVVVTVDVDVVVTVDVAVEVDVDVPVADVVDVVVAVAVAVAVVVAVAVEVGVAGTGACPTRT